MDDMTYPDKPRKQGPDSVLVMGSIFTRLRAVFSNNMDITLLSKSKEKRKDKK